MEDVQSALCTVNDDNTIQDMKEQTMDNDEDMDCDSGAENLDLMVGLMDEHSELQSEIVKLCNSFVEDMGERMRTWDIPYPTGLKKLFSVYLETIYKTHLLCYTKIIFTFTYIFLQHSNISQLSSWH